MKPPPWSRRWDQLGPKGVEDVWTQQTAWFKKKFHKSWVRFFYLSLFYQDSLLLGITFSFSKKDYFRIFKHNSSHFSKMLLSEHRLRKVRHNRGLSHRLESGLRVADGGAHEAIRKGAARSQPLQETHSQKCR